MSSSGLLLSLVNQTSSRTVLLGAVQQMSLMYTKSVNKISFINPYFRFIEVCYIFIFDSYFYLKIIIYFCYIQVIYMYMYNVYVYIFF